MSAPVTFQKKVAASDRKLAATCLRTIKKFFSTFRRRDLNSRKMAGASQGAELLLLAKVSTEGAADTEAPTKARFCGEWCGSP